MQQVLDYFFGTPRSHNEPPQVFVENRRVYKQDPSDPLRMFEGDPAFAATPLPADADRAARGGPVAFGAGNGSFMDGKDGDKLRDARQQSTGSPSGSGHRIS